MAELTAALAACLELAKGPYLMYGTVNGQRRAVAIIHQLGPTGFDIEIPYNMKLANEPSHYSFGSEHDLWRFLADKYETWFTMFHRSDLTTRVLARRSELILRDIARWTHEEAAAKRVPMYAWTAMLTALGCAAPRAAVKLKKAKIAPLSPWKLKGFVKLPWLTARSAIAVTMLPSPITPGVWQMEVSVPTVDNESMALVQQAYRAVEEKLRDELDITLALVCAGTDLAKEFS